MSKLSTISLALTLACPLAVQAQDSDTPQDDIHTLAPTTVEASADASAEGLMAPYAGGQVARGGRVGILGNRDNMASAFSVTSYTNELIQDRHARSVGDVLQNDPGVRIARGFGNFQESYFIRGFILGSDDVAYNGLYNLLPRQYIATELFERVEVLRGASAFLSGATPSGSGAGGAINLLPKRAPSQPLTHVTAGWTADSQWLKSADIGRRFGAEQRFGVRFNAAHRDGDTSVDDESAELSLTALGLDWRGDRLRLSGDIGWQDNRLKRTRTNVTLAAGVTKVPSVPDASRNFAQRWTFSNEKDLFGTLRGEYDISDNLTAWAAYGMRRSEEENSLANVTVTDGATGNATFYRFDNTREDRVDTGEAGVRGTLSTGPIGHEWVLSASYFELEKDNAYVMDWQNTRQTNIYRPSYLARPAYSATALFGNDLDSPDLNGRTRLVSFAVGDTLSLIDDRLLLTLGLRHQQLRNQDFAYNTGIPGNAYDESKVTPAVGVVYKARPDISLYANYIESLAQGATAPGTAVNQGEMLAPYVSEQQELGIKYDGGRLGGGLSYFTTSKPRGFVNTDNRFVEAGEDEHQGLELTIFGEAARGVRVLGGATYLDAEQRKTGSASTDGKRVIGVPEIQANIGVEWEVPGILGLAVDSRAVYTGSSYADATNTLKVPGWTRLDAGVRYYWEVQDKLVTLRGRVDNIANRDYWASVGGYPGSGYLTVGAPRTLSVTASVDF